MLETAFLEQSKNTLFWMNISAYSLISFMFFLLPFSIYGQKTYQVLPLERNLPHPALREGMHYTVIFKGITNPALLGLFKETSTLISLEKKPPQTLEGLRRRILEDLPRLMKVLESLGYYDGQIFPFLRGGLHVSMSGKYQIILEVFQGPQYYLNSFVINIPNIPPDVAMLTKNLDNFGIQIPCPAQAETITNSEIKLISKLSTIGYPFAKTQNRSITINEQTHAMDVILDLDLGPLTYFGAIYVEGLKNLNPSYVFDDVPWTKGDVFNTAKVDKFRRILMQSNIFTSVEVTPQTKPSKDGDLPIRVKVIENKRQYIGLGARYASSEGGSLKSFWGNRNLFGNGEKLDLTGQVGRIKSVAEATFTKPHFLRPDQSLITSVEGGVERPDAYTKHGIDALTQISRRIDESWTVGYGVGYGVSRVKTNGFSQPYNLPSFPIDLSYSTINNILDPTQGIKAQWSLVPYPQILGGQSNFARIFLRQLFHQPLTKHDTVVFSGYVNLGFMPGGNRNSVPPDKLFYAGGSGSVRGYAYQMAGPLDSNNNPLGGSSAFESGVELLTKITHDIGIATFVDAGTVYNRAYPTFSNALFWSVGGGVRYYTSIGPLRLDIAFPTKRRPGIDDPYQIYAGIGQSF